MIFQLWQHPKGEGESRCITEKKQDNVKSEFHTLKVGQDRIIHEDANWQIVIVRSE